MSDQLETMKANLETSTGRSLDEWVAQVRADGQAKHGAIVTRLKAEHGLGHGYANLIATTARRTDEAPASDDALVDAQYTGKEHLRPVYEAVVVAVAAFGDDVEVAPKKTSVSLRRARQFALVTPSTRTRVDVGLNLRGLEPTLRLRSSTGMCTHTVAVTEVDQVDAELVDWLRDAYDRAGSATRPASSG